MQTRRLAVAAIALVAWVGPTGAAAAGVPEGLSGHKVTFRVTSPDADRGCVSYYETDAKGGAALEFPVRTEAVDFPFKTSVGTGSKLGHWHITAWAADDCAATDPPDGTVKCRVRADGKVKDTTKATDALVFCYF
jgi:hypothetical protein